MQRNTSFSGHVEAMLASHRAQLFALQYERVIATQPRPLADRIECEIERLVASINRLCRTVAAGPVTLADTSFPLAGPRTRHDDAGVARSTPAAPEPQIDHRHVATSGGDQCRLVGLDGVLTGIAHNPEDMTAQCAERRQGCRPSRVGSMSPANSYSACWLVLTSAGCNGRTWCSSLLPAPALLRLQRHLANRTLARCVWPK